MDLIKLEFPLSVLLDLGFPGRKTIQTLQALRRFFVYIDRNLYATKTGSRITATHCTTKLLAILQWHPVSCYFTFFPFFLLWPLPLVNLLQDCLHLRLAATRLEKFRFQAIRGTFLRVCPRRHLIWPEVIFIGLLWNHPVYWHILASNIWLQNVSHLYIHIIFISTYL